MPKYVIERDIPGAGSMSPDELGHAAATSCGVLEKLGNDIQWIHSYVTGDRVYCIYTAPSEALVREHAEQSGFPANRISEVKAIIDPTRAAAAAKAA
ncbi:MAG: DUF4242 domain-containing protein [Pyrinomonadaceae bacterium]